MRYLEILETLVQIRADELSPTVIFIRNGKANECNWAFVSSSFNIPEVLSSNTKVSGGERETQPCRKTVLTKHL